MSQPNRAQTAPLAKDLRLATLARKAAEIQEKGTPLNTRRAYQGDWDRFVTWCAEFELSPLPASSQSLVLWITHLAEEGKSASTIERSVAAICYAHRVTSHPSPRSQEVTEHLSRTKKAIKRAPVKAPPLLAEDLKKIILPLGYTEIDVRDRAILLVGWSGALRSSEICGLRIKDVLFRKGKMLLRIHESKTDQEATGIELPIAKGSSQEMCPEAAVREWLRLRKGDGDTQLFCGSTFGILDHMKRLPEWEVNRIVQRRAAEAHVGPEAADRFFSSHSLRAGFITSATLAGAPSWRVREHSRHKSNRVFEGYIRNANPFENHPGEGLL